MNKILTICLFVFLPILVHTQMVSISPEDAGPGDEVSIIFDASQGNGELMGANKVYMHHGVVTDAPNGTEWQYVVGNWGQDDGVGQMTKIAGEDNKWKFDIAPSVREYFSVPAGNNIFRISCVFRSADGSKKGTIAPGQYPWGLVTSNQDNYIDLTNKEGFITLLNPTTEEETVFINLGESITIEAKASDAVTSMTISLDEGQGFTDVTTVSSGTTISYNYTPSQSINLLIKIRATINGNEVTLEHELQIFIKNESEIAPLPEGLLPGINYHQDETKVTIVLEAPGKDFVYVGGDFTEWQVDNNYQMKKTPDGEMFWLEISGLESKKEYVFLYLVDGILLIADPYAEKVADPWNDKFIEEEVYPDLPEYDLTQFGIASVLQTGQQPFDWGSGESAWQRPDVNHLMIYELHIRDFLASHSYKDLIDTLPYLKRLGIDAIELMPINEFEGNDSWGYNPSFFLAPDKYYGTKDDLKRFVEAAHENGLAVILDIVLNHAFGQNPMVQMYFDAEAYKPAADNPWFNREYVGQYQWGFDFNHESPYTQRFVDRVNKYWLEEYHFDGFRFDFTKGFTNYAPNGSVDGYDESRINLLKRMADKIWEVDDEAYIILEHWSPFQEELELGEYGMKMWSNRSYDYVPAASGAPANSFNDMDRTSHVAFFNSHDERRIAEHLLTEGRSSGAYNLKDTIIMFERVKMAAAFAFLNPGPKMMWQFDELGYDIDINFNGRTGRKPLPWGQGSLEYYEDPLRQNIYKTYQGILDVRKTITPQLLASAETDHKLTGDIRRLNYNTSGIDLVVVGNFGLIDGSIDPSFQSEGTWYNYFSGDSIQGARTNEAMDLAAGEWHIFTSKKLSEGLPGVIEVFNNPVTITPYPFTKEEEITLRFDATKAQNGGTEGLVGAEKVYIHSGIVKDDPQGSDLENIVGTLTDDGLGLMSKIEENIWEIKFTPEEYYNTSNDENIFKIGMYFRDAANEHVGLGFRDQNIYFDVASGKPLVTIDPPSFDKDTEITITFDAGQGNQELIGENKVYIHSSPGLVDSDRPQDNAWRNVVGNWGQDDGIGQMSKVDGTENLWQIKLTPRSYYSLSDSDNIYWMAMVFRNADGSKKGTGQPGTMDNGFIDDKQDFFIKNGGTSSFEDYNTITNASIFPNPTPGHIDLSSYDDNLTFQVFTLDGKVVMTQKLSGNKIYNLSHLNKGIYMYRIHGNKKFQSGKIVLH